MPHVSTGQRVVARLRAYRVLPEGRAAHLVRPCGFEQALRPLRWQIADPVSGQAYGVGSEVPAKELLGYRRWKFRSSGGMTLVEPDNGESSQVKP